MSVVRACLPCRTAKAKVQDRLNTCTYADIVAQCDLIRPTCGRCTQRRLVCSGFPEDAGFIFRDENEVAQRNSQRARGEWKQIPVAAASSLANIVRQGQQLQEAGDMTDEFLQKQYSWLNERALAEVPGPLKKDLETRAVERFFINWTLYPSNHGESPGKVVTRSRSQNRQLFS
jgi:hypothetical protein